MKIYTRTGDTGSTGLFGGPRVAKDDDRIEAYTVSAENFESIHNHSAYAEITRGHSSL